MRAFDGSSGLFIDYCFFCCTRQRLEDPSLLIKAGWIRPEDLSAYEALGYHTFKQIERGMPSAELLKRARAYAKRRFEGNLAELILPYGFRDAPRLGRGWALRFFFCPWQVSPLRLKELYELARLQGLLFPQRETPIVIDSERIPPDFIDHFRSFYANPVH